MSPWRCVISVDAPRARANDDMNPHGSGLRSSAEVTYIHQEVSRVSHIVSAASRDLEEIQKPLNKIIKTKTELVISLKRFCPIFNLKFCH